jgi:hypothetical protein
MDEQLRQLLYDYAIAEQDNPSPTGKDVDDSFKEGVDHYGSVEKLKESLLYYFGKNV